MLSGANLVPPRKEDVASSGQPASTQPAGSSAVLEPMYALLKVPLINEFLRKIQDDEGPRDAAICSGRRADCDAKSARDY